MAEYESGLYSIDYVSHDVCGFRHSDRMLKRSMWQNWTEEWRAWQISAIVITFGAVSVLAFLALHQELNTSYSFLATVKRL